MRPGYEVVGSSIDEDGEDGEDGEDDDALGHHIAESILCVLGDPAV